MSAARQQKAREIIERVRAIRQERFGQDVASLAEELNVPTRTWLNYEEGVTMPGVTMLGFLVTCEADPFWVLNGRQRPVVESSEKN
jgi:hypothetical protein